jgi:hypothetical protein
VGDGRRGGGTIAGGVAHTGRGSGTGGELLAWLAECVEHIPQGTHNLGILGGRALGFCGLQIAAHT